MQYRLRTLLTLTGTLPPTIAVAALISKAAPVVAVLAVIWSVSFFVSLARQQHAKTRFGLTLTELLAIAAIVFCTVSLLIPSEWPEVRE
jgi:NO-binding membrane sensor protein with MHYT domain